MKIKEIGIRDAEFGGRISDLESQISDAKLKISRRTRVILKIKLAKLILLFRIPQEKQ